MDRVGLSCYFKQKKCVCDAHQFETVVKSKLVHYKSKRFVQHVAPVGKATKSSLSPSDKMLNGIGSNRALRMIFDEANKSEVAPGLLAQEGELEELIEQLQLEYHKIKCA